MDSRTHHIACKGECSGARHCKTKFSIFFKRNKTANGKQQCDICVSSGTLAVNLHICPECHKDSRTDHIACKGECSGARHCKSKFSIFFKRNKTVNGKQQCDICVSSKAARRDTKKKCYKCQEERNEAEYNQVQWSLTGPHANRRKCSKCFSA